MALEARLRGLTKSKLFTAAKAKGVVADIATVMQNHTDDVIKQLHYPPPPEFPSYERTNTLNDSWRSNLRITSGGITVYINNDATDPWGRQYAVLVLGDEHGMGQLQVHKLHYWPLFAEVLRKGYNQKIRKAVHDALSS